MDLERLTAFSQVVPRPRVPLVLPTVLLDLPLEEPARLAPRLLCPYPELEVLGVPGAGLPVNRLTRPPLVLRAGVAAFLRSSSSALRAAVSLLCCSSYCRRCASWRRLCSSFSISAMSCVAPCHCGLRIRRWLCSVCERMRVQV